MKMKVNSNINGTKVKMCKGCIFLTTSFVMLNSFGLVNSKVKGFTGEVKQLNYTSNNYCYITNERIEEEYDNLRIKTIEDLLKMYCNVYNLNFEKVQKLAKKNTGNYYSFTLLNKNNFEKTDVRYDNLELGILEFTRNLNRYNSEYKDNVYVKEKTINEMVDYYSELYGIDNNLVKAIEYFESGFYECPIATVRNNPGSLRSNGDFFIYENIEQGIIEHIRCLKKNYIDQGLTTPETIQPKYCPGSTTWPSRVNYFYYKLKSDNCDIVIYDEREKENEKVKTMN